MTLTEENRSTSTKYSPRILSARNLERTGLGSNRVLRGDRTTSNYLCHGMALTEDKLSELY